MITVSINAGSDISGISQYRPVMWGNLYICGALICIFMDPGFSYEGKNQLLELYYYGKACYYKRSIFVSNKSRHDKANPDAVFKHQLFFEN